MDDLRLPFKLRWAGEPMPDISEFAEPLVISFKFRGANPVTTDVPFTPETRTTLPPAVIINRIPSDPQTNATSTHLSEMTRSTGRIRSNC